MNTQIPLKYSQNLLRDTQLIETLISLSDLTKKDTVLDIGAGKGIISQVLAEKVSKVIAVEKDQKLFLLAKQNLRLLKNVELRNEDFLNSKLPKNEYKVFANIPFSITSEITKKLFESENPPISAYLFMQKEAASRFLGSPLYKESLLSLLYKPIYSIKTIYNFRREDFDPVPSKDVVMIEFKLKTKTDIDNRNYPLYRDFVSFAFNRWKPNIKLALKGTLSNLQLKIISSNLGFSLDDKPSELSYELWQKLFKEFIQIVPKYKQRYVLGSFAKININQMHMKKVNKENLERTLQDKIDNPRPPKRNAWRGRKY